jgi:hypothetical protein
VKYKGLKRRVIPKKKGSRRTEHIIPQKKEKGSYARTKDYEYFKGHIVPDIVGKLPKKNVICWYNDHNLSLPVCAIKKFWQLQKHCKKCPLFQGDEHAQVFKSIIDLWETDDLEEDGP